MSSYADRREGYFISRDGRVKKFDFNLRRCVPENGGYTKKQRRVFQRLMSWLDDWQESRRTFEVYDFNHKC